MMRSSSDKSLEKDSDLSLITPEVCVLSEILSLGRGLSPKRVILLSL
jgi:hypothetical protein